LPAISFRLNLPLERMSPATKNLEKAMNEGLREENLMKIAAVPKVIPPRISIV
jgi:hypothetical protein